MLYPSYPQTANSKKRQAFVSRQGARSRGQNRNTFTRGCPLGMRGCSPRRKRNMKNSEETGSPGPKLKVTAGFASFMGRRLQFRVGFVTPGACSARPRRRQGTRSAEYAHPLAIFSRSAQASAKGTAGTPPCARGCRAFRRGARRDLFGLRGPAVRPAAGLLPRQRWRPRTGSACAGTGPRKLQTARRARRDTRPRAPAPPAAQPPLRPMPTPWTGRSRSSSLSDKGHRLRRVVAVAAASTAIALVNDTQHAQHGQVV